MIKFAMQCFRVLLTVGAIVLYLVVANMLSGPNDPYNPESFGYER